MPRLVFLFAICSLSSCIRQNYYLNPFNANSNFYHAMPLKSDSIKAINYLNGNISYGGANVYRDDVLAFHSEFYRTHSFGIFEAYYGIDFSLGYYEIIKRQ